MTNVHTDVLTSEEIAFINSLDSVISAEEEILHTQASSVKFTAVLPDSIKDILKTKLGLDLFSITDVPMRFIRGDTSAHVDQGESSFENTYIIYLTDSEGEFIIGDDTFEIKKGNAFVFPEGLSHETKGTNDTVRLAIGPMSESGFPVGVGVYYYLTYQDAINVTNLYYSTGSFTIESFPVTPYNTWKIAPNSNGTSSQTTVYKPGDTLNPDGNYYLYYSVACFLEGSTILCLIDNEEKYVPIQDMRKGTLVKTLENGYRKVELIGRKPFINSGSEERGEQQLYVCSKEKYPELTEDLVLTGDHSILVGAINDEQRKKMTELLGEIFVTENNYRLLAFLDDRAEPWSSMGEHTIWHFALESDNIYVNYGVYANGGLLVESSPIRFIRDKAFMELIE
uniref:Hedgehog/Intein (Hint) domain-containing protein n=1 Tax=viral metagenome TaxID=1070528 RepID=A0A6C0BV58_9ZZZZ